MTSKTYNPAAEAQADYLRRYELHCEREQIEFNGGLPALWCVHDWTKPPEDRANDHHTAALIILWSMDAEAQNPKPPGLA